MVTAEEKHYIMTHAYVPEHLVDLVTLVSRGEPFLADDYLCVSARGWLIIVGYALQGEFFPDTFATSMERILNRFHPRDAWLIAPVLPPSISASSLERESDHYYTLDLHEYTLRGSLKRIVQKTRTNLTVERSTAFDRAHRELAQEFIERVKPHPRVRELLFAMPEYVLHSQTCTVLDARDNQGRLTAFYVVELAARDFATYVIGCHSRKNYVPWASDLLMYEMVALSIEHRKSYIHLGLGVNEGIRRFKEKWGGLPTRRYEMCRLALTKPSIIRSLMGFQECFSRD